MCHRWQSLFSSSLLFVICFSAPSVTQTFLPFMNSNLPTFPFTSSGVRVRIGKDFKPGFQNTRRTDTATGNGSFLTISTPLIPNEPQRESLRCLLLSAPSLCGSAALSQGRGFLFNTVPSVSRARVGRVGMRQKTLSNTQDEGWRSEHRERRAFGLAGRPASQAFLLHNWPDPQALEAPPPFLWIVPVSFLCIPSSSRSGWCRFNSDHPATTSQLWGHFQFKLKEQGSLSRLPEPPHLLCSSFQFVASTSRPGMNPLFRCHLALCSHKQGCTWAFVCVSLYVVLAITCLMTTIIMT